MDGELAAEGPSVLNDGGVADVEDLMEDVEFNESFIARLLIGDLVELIFFSKVDISNIAKPIVDESKLGILHGCSDAATLIVAADNNMFYTEIFNAVLQNREAIKIGVGKEVRDVSMDKHLTWLKPNDFISRDAAIGTTDP